MINMVASLDGRAAVDGKAASLGSPTDRALMRALRARADAVMTGAGTIRAEKLTLTIPEDLARSREARGLAPQPLAVIATTTGDDIPLEKNLLGSSPDNLLILTSTGIPKERSAILSSYASVEAVPKEPASDRLDPKQALITLKERYDINMLLVEGGPALNHALVSAGLVDEIFLTLAPKLLGGERPDVLTILEGPRLSSQNSQNSPQENTKAEPISIHLSRAGELLLRYALSNPTRALQDP